MAKFEGTDATGKGARHSLAGFLWGPSLALSLPLRIGIFVLTLAIIAAMSFCQLGFWLFGTVNNTPVYLMLILGPLTMGALAFGPFLGGVLGLATGAMLYLHANLFPLDSFETYFMTPLNTFVLFTGIGIAAGLVFALLARRTSWKVSRYVLIAGVCFLASCAASILIMMNTIMEYSFLGDLEAVRATLFGNPWGMVAQILIDALFMMLVCFIFDAVMRQIAARSHDFTLSEVFGSWLMLVSTIVFLFMSALLFSATSLQARDMSSKSMFDEIGYLNNLMKLDSDIDRDEVLEGYTVEDDGRVAIIDKAGIIEASNDHERYPKGEYFFLRMNELATSEDYQGLFDEDMIKEMATLLPDLYANEHELMELETTDANGMPTRDLAFVAVDRCDDGYIAIIRDADLTYRARFSTLTALTLLTIALIAAIGITSTRLLRRVVVRRIDETNDSLAAITEGNLEERVQVKDTREFNSLANGINSTVAALGGMVDEVEKRNAQDLATAKTIQESSLPREFPPFPNIDEFDIYASMKPAKEVGGDFYDFFLIGEDEGRLGFVMADVSGKGIPASLFMMAAKTQLRDYMVSGMSLGEAVGATNHQLCQGNEAGMFVTVWVGELDYHSGQLIYVNAGHNPPMLLHEGAWEWLTKVSGLPLGLYDGIDYKLYEHTLEPGDAIYAYTDGVTEAMDKDGELFKGERLEAVLGAHAQDGPREIDESVHQAIASFVQDAEQSDDITMLTLRYGRASNA